MTPQATRVLPLIVLLLAAPLALPAQAGVKVTRPAAAKPVPKPAPKLLLDDAGEAATANQEPISPRSLQVGQVIFARGNQVVAEVDTEVVDNEYLVVFDSGFRRKGAARVVKALKGNTYLLRGAGTSLAEGDRLGRETELQAISRALNQQSAESYRAFLARFPDSSYAERVAREMFRLQMQAEYPARPGSSVGGMLRLTETVGSAVPLEDAQVVLDRFVVALTEVGGEYRIDGIPLPEVDVTVKLRVKDPKFRPATEVTLDLPAGRSVDSERELPVMLTPTVLSGTVLDEAGEPLAGAEVWTSPYTLEFLTGEDGTFQISRAKDLDEPGTADSPLMGGEFEVYARRDGYSVERVQVSAASFVSNPVPPIRLEPRDTRNEAVPELEVVLRSHLHLDPSALAGSGGVGPMINP